jgi:hypothetical protein
VTRLKFGSWKRKSRSATPEKARLKTFARRNVSALSYSKKGVFFPESLEGQKKLIVRNFNYKKWQKWQKGQKWQNDKNGKNGTFKAINIRNIRKIYLSVAVVILFSAALSFSLSSGFSVSAVVIFGQSPEIKVFGCFSVFSRFLDDIVVRLWRVLEPELGLVPSSWWGTLKMTMSNLQ